MASIGWEGDRAKLNFRDEAGKQKSLRLGRCSERAASIALEGFEWVLQANRLGSTLHADGVRWLERLDDCLHARVVRLGLCEPRKSAAVVTVSELLQRFDAAAAVKDSTRAAYKQTTDSLRAHLGERTALASIGPADADRWRKAIAEPVEVVAADGTKTTKRLALATVAKRVFVARAIFKRAVRWGLIASNPFADVRAGSQANPDRAFYVTPASIRAILEACPDDEWRAIVALARFGGLRCPSEIIALRWGDVNWERGRMMVRSVKTEGHEGHAVRVVPIAPELRPILQTLFDRAEVGAEAVVPRLRDPSMNLRTMFRKIIARAGEKPWPRLFHNLRASCATDWVERFPNHVVAGWLGHSPLIAAAHYLQTRDAHFELAAAVGTPGEAASNPPTQPPTNAATQAQPQNDPHDQDGAQSPENKGFLVGCGVGCDDTQNEAMGEEGFEPPKA
jgi:integrase